LATILLPSGRSPSTRRRTRPGLTSSDEHHRGPINRRLLGSQIVGHLEAQVAKPIDIPAVALFAEMSVEVWATST
jgi:hypothetical protein